jgi:hypothetical protein
VNRIRSRCALRDSRLSALAALATAPQVSSVLFFGLTCSVCEKGTAGSRSPVRRVRLCVRCVDVSGVALPTSPRGPPTGLTTGSRGGPAGGAPGPHAQVLFVGCFSSGIPQGL